MRIACQDGKDLIPVIAASREYVRKKRRKCGSTHELWYRPKRTMHDKFDSLGRIIEVIMTIGVTGRYVDETASISSSRLAAWNGLRTRIRDRL